MQNLKFLSLKKDFYIEKIHELQEKSGIRNSFYDILIPLFDLRKQIMGVKME